MPTRLHLLILLLFYSVISINAQETGDNITNNEDAANTVTANSILGNWEIDLRPSPDAEPYLQEFQVTEITGNTFQGFFYGSLLEDAKINRNWDRLYFAFTTRDQNHAYYHSGYLLDGKLYGLSHCPGREFIQPWTGVMK